MNASNNVNGVGKVARTEVYTLESTAACWTCTRRSSRKIVTELNASTTSTTRSATSPISAASRCDGSTASPTSSSSTERRLPRQHLIAQNIANKSAKIDEPHPAVSIFNFHYAIPEAVRLNYGLNKAIGDDETGFRGTARRDLPQRGVGLPARRRRALQQPRLLVRRRAGERQVRLPADAAGRRQRRAEASAADSQPVHQRFRLHPDGAGRLGDRRRCSCGRIRPGPGRARPGDGDLRSQVGAASANRLRNRFAGKNETPAAGGGHGPRRTADPSGGRSLAGGVDRHQIRAPGPARGCRG